MSVVQGHWGKLQHELCVDGALSACDGLICGDARDDISLKDMSDGAPVVWHKLDEPADLGGCRQNKLAEMNSLDYETELNATQVMEYESNGGGALATMNRCFLYILDFVDSDYEQLFLYLEDFDFVMEVEIAVRNLFSFMRHVMELMSVERAWMCWLITMMSILLGSHLGLSRWFEDGMVGTSRSSTSSLTRTTRNRMRVRRAQWKMQLKAMLFASWIPCCQGMEGATAGESTFLQQMSNLATAATRAANAAEKAIGLLSQSAAPSSSGDQGGLQAASRILKCPDAYNGEDPMAFSSWKFTFCSWLSFGDPRFQRYFDRIDKLGASEDLPEYAAVDQELSVKLRAILTSYLKGRCTSLVKSMARSKDGFRIWRALQQEYEPSSRQRSLAIAQTLSNFPAFSGSKTLHEHILAYEQLVAQFEEVSASSYPSELKIATLVRCSNQKLREHLQLTIGEQTTYAQLKETMLGYDKACRSWTPETILKSIQQQNTPSGDQGGELAVALEVGPWDLRRGINTEVKVAKPTEVPLPLLHPPIGGVEPEIEDEEAKVVIKYAQDHPQEDVDEGEIEVQPLDFEEGGVSVMVSDEVQSDQEIDADQKARENSAPGDLRLPVPVRQRVSEVEASRRGQQNPEEGQAKFVKFDPNTEIPEPSPKQPRTLYSPVYAGNVADSPGTASVSRHVRRVIEELEMVDDDEMDYAIPGEVWDWEVCDSVEMARRGFHNEGAGPPEVTQEELDWLDEEAMKMELNRLKELHVIDNVSDDVAVEDCVRLDTRLVRDWRYRDGRWRRRARLVAREFRDGDCSHIDTFSPTTPLPIVKLLIFLSMLYDLAIRSLDVGDAFLQVPQRTTVLIEVPLWHNKNKVKVINFGFCVDVSQVNVQQLQSGINSLWKYVHDMDSTISKVPFSSTESISAHLDDLLVVGSKEFILGFHDELSKELKLKIEGPLQCGGEGSIYYLKRELQFTKHGFYVAPSSRYIPRLLEILKIKDRRGRTIPHHGCLEIFDATSIADDEFLNGDDAKVFRSALGICIHLSQERCEIQHPVRVLATYMARPTKTAMSAVKKLGSYLMWTKEMKLYYGKAELYQSVMQRWFGGQQRLESKPFMLELFSDSDWATCKPVDAAQVQA